MGAPVALMEQLQAIVLLENAHNTAISGLFKKNSGLKYSCLLPLPALHALSSPCQIKAQIIHNAVSVSEEANK